MQLVHTEESVVRSRYRRVWQGTGLGVWVVLLLTWGLARAAWLAAWIAAVLVGRRVPPFSGLARVGPLGEVPGMSTLVQAQVLDVVTRSESAVLAPRWQTTGPGGRLFPPWTPTSG